MAKQYAEIDDARRAFIARQHIFFTASAAAGTRINLSPRPTTHFHILGPNAVAYCDLTGSGSETAAHLLADGRLTIMFCAFEGAPSILRLYGRGRSAVLGTREFDDFIRQHYGAAAPTGARQIVFLDIDLVQTSCGFGVPLFEHVGERDTLDRWAASKGEEGLADYRREKNALSMDGLPTGIPG
ncbi:pyridoxamine 5'-phosphate oxidase family protein [Jiella sp. M17.18]|uniref:pyridoxamine 5'-phosphate oxidase family protein n=1 Tax=Jiella sp. M17.18 TaxID=3234247 RepID=UPI0034E03A4A